MHDFALSKKKRVQWDCAICCAGPWQRFGRISLFLWGRTSTTWGGVKQLQQKLVHSFAIHTNAIHLAYLTFFAEGQCVFWKWISVIVLYGLRAKERQEHYHNWITTNRPQPHTERKPQCPSHNVLIHVYDVIYDDDRNYHSTGSALLELTKLHLKDRTFSDRFEHLSSSPASLKD